MESIFKFKRASKTIGDFDANDPNEWTLLIKPQMGGISDFIHMQRMWLVEEKPAVEADPDNGIEGSPEVKKQYAIRVTRGFVRDDSFIVEKDNTTAVRHEVDGNARFVALLKTYVDNDYKKDWVNYNADNTSKTPSYYEHEKSKMGGFGMDMSGAMKSIQQMAAQVMPGGNPHVQMGSPFNVQKTILKAKNNP